jgi:hypothetical protein
MSGSRARRGAIRKSPEFAELARCTEFDKYPGRPTTQSANYGDFLANACNSGEPAGFVHAGRSPLRAEEADRPPFRRPPAKSRFPATGDRGCGWRGADDRPLVGVVPFISQMADVPACGDGITAISTPWPTSRGSAMALPRPLPTRHGLSRQNVDIVRQRSTISARRSYRA